MDYNALNAKLSAMFGRLLKRADYEELSKQRSVESVGMALKEYSSYTKSLASLSDSALRRDPIERRLKLSLYGDYTRICAFVIDHRLREFLDSYFLKHEIYTLKVLLCMLYDERDITQELVDIPPSNTRLELSKLAAAGNVAELINCLKNTQYYPVLSRAYDEDRSLFELEIQLDLYYYMQLARSMLKLDKVNANLMKKIIEMEVDLRNIIWIYRLKTYYKIDRNMIYTYLIPTFHKLNRGYLDSLTSASTPGELNNAIASGPYGRSFSPDSRPERLYDLESGRVYSAVRRKHPQSLAAVVAYMYFKELEINNITSLLECVRYGLSSGDSLKHINHYYGLEKEADAW